jgi:hypothetical protein
MAGFDEVRIRPLDVVVLAIRDSGRGRGRGFLCSGDLGGFREIEKRAPTTDDRDQDDECDEQEKEGFHKVKLAMEGQVGEGENQEVVSTAAKAPSVPF